MVSFLLLIPGGYLDIIGKCSGCREISSGLSMCDVISGNKSVVDESERIRHEVWAGIQGWVMQGMDWIIKLR
jgi:hypothetical protein